MNNQMRLRMAGEALYGARWRTSVAADLGVTYRTIRRWVMGSRVIPDHVWSELSGNLRAREQTLDVAFDAIEQSKELDWTELNIALDFAQMAHAGQTDKSGDDYMGHVLRLYNRVTGPKAKITAVLHDVVEDSDFTLDDLRAAGISDEVVDAVEALTKCPGEDKGHAVARARYNEIARVVKLADLEDNADITRFDHPTDDDRERCQHYQDLMEILT